MDNLELDNLLIRYKNSINTQLQEKIMFLNVLYNTGCRVQEPFDITRWSILNSSEVQLITLKYNVPRIINLIDLPDNFINKIYKQIDYSYYNSKSLAYDLKKELGKFIFNGNQRHTTSHAFRYNFIKRMNYIGWDISVIQQMIGHTKLETTEYYLNAEINYFPNK